MQKLLYWSLALAGLLTACTSSEPPAEEPQNPQVISFSTSDSLLISGELFHQDHDAPCILLFHQGRSNARGEYAAIAPRLHEGGFNVLMIDQRRGGQAYGSYNRVVAEIERNPYGYCEVLPDLEAALQYVIDQGYRGPKVLWGSSYSAALVIQLAHLKPQAVSGVLAFSPASGEPMEGCNPEQYFASLKVPLIIFRPAREAAIESVATQLVLAQTAGHQTYIAENGVHGSSMLVSTRVDGSTAPHWEMVNQFLRQFE